MTDQTKLTEEDKLYNDAIKEDSGVFKQRLRAYVQKQVEAALENHIKIGSEDYYEMLKLQRRSAVEKAMGELRATIKKTLAIRKKSYVAYEGCGLIDKMCEVQLQIDDIEWCIAQIDIHYPRAKETKKEG